MVVTVQRMPNDEKWPILVHGAGREALSEWMCRSQVEIDALLGEHGAILFRGFGIDSEAAFGELARRVFPELLEYVYRSTPRTTLRKGVYTATEYPPPVTIPQHNENAYQRDWPMRLLFACIQPSLTGGDTPLADSRRVTRRLSGRIMDTFAEKGVMYVRNYHEYIDVQWQTVFQTKERSVVEEFCRNNDIECEWSSAGVLRTKQRCQGVAVHPTSGERLFFNQAHLFHASALDAATRKALLKMYDEARLPRNAYYGDGSPLDESTLGIVRDAYRAESVRFPWQRGDLLLVDNMLVSHGRTPFTGPRKILVAMTLPYSNVATV